MLILTFARTTSPIAEMIEKGYAEEKSDDKLHGKDEKVWYVATMGSTVKRRIRYESCSTAVETSMAKV